MHVARHQLLDMAPFSFLYHVDENSPHYLDRFPNANASFCNTESAQLLLHFRNGANVQISIACQQILVEKHCSIDLSCVNNFE